MASCAKPGSTALARESHPELIFPKPLTLNANSQTPLNPKPYIPKP